MKNNNATGSNIMTYKFAALFATLVALTVIFYLLFLNNKSLYKNGTAGSNAPEVAQQLLPENAALLNKLKELQKLDEQYSALFKQSTVTPAMDSVDTQIAQQEYLFNNIIDSFDNNKVNYSTGNRKLYNEINSFFKQVLESRRTVGNIRYALAAGNFDFDSSQKRWLKLNSDLLIKDNRIAALENQLQANNGAAGNTDLTSENEKLRSALKGEEKKNVDLLSVNTSLKQDIKTLNSDLSNLRKLNLTSKRNDINRVPDATPENMTSELNAEVQLAKISCNLTRADVKQIISNSRQRKELLSEALNVLTTLSKSADPLIQNKAKEKLTELHRISETIRD